MSEAAFERQELLSSSHWAGLGEEAFSLEHESLESLGRNGGKLKTMRGHLNGGYLIKQWPFK